MLFHCAPNREFAVKQALRAAGATVFDFSFDLQGLFLWQADDT